MGVPIQQECVTYFVPALGKNALLLRLVMQEKETCLETRSLGSILIFSGEAYKKHYGRDAVQTMASKQRTGSLPLAQPIAFSRLARATFHMGWEPFFEICLQQSGNHSQLICVRQSLA